MRSEHGILRTDVLNLSSVSSVELYSAQTSVKIACHPFGLEARSVSIPRQYVETASQLAIGPPKSRAGIRTVGIPRVIIPALRDTSPSYVGAEDTALVFAVRAGRRPSPSSACLAPSALPETSDAVAGLGAAPRPLP
jgi:hypothetical protein